MAKWSGRIWEGWMEDGKLYSHLEWTCSYTNDVVRAINFDYIRIASYPDLSAYMQTFTCNYFLPFEKTGRSGRFGDVTWTWFEHTWLWFQLLRHTPLTVHARYAVSIFYLCSCSPLTSVRGRYQRLVQSRVYNRERERESIALVAQLCNQLRSTKCVVENIVNTLHQ